MITSENVRSRLRGEFRPFRIRMSDGRAFPVPHPDFISVGRNVLAIITADDISHSLSLLHVVSLEEVEPAIGPALSAG